MHAPGDLVRRQHLLQLLLHHAHKRGPHVGRGVSIKISLFAYGTSGLDVLCFGVVAHRWTRRANRSKSP